MAPNTVAVWPDTDERPPVPRLSTEGAGAACGDVAGRLAAAAAVADVLSARQAHDRAPERSHPSEVTRAKGGGHIFIAPEKDTIA